MRALIVDDSAPVRRRLLAELRERSAVEAFEACDADAALRIVRTAAIDVVILDLCLGQRRAFELIGQIKAERPATAVLILTNETGEAQRRECLLRGADHFFDKSLQFEAALEVALGSAERH